MKTSIKIAALIFSLTFVACQNNDDPISDRDVTTKGVEDWTVKTPTWDYPVKPGTAKWESLNSLEQKLEVCQIPTDVLQKVGTEELVEMCVNYPLRFNYFAYGNTIMGIDVNIEQFNGLQELMKRPDNAKSLFFRIKQFNEYLAGKKLTADELVSLTNMRAVVMAIMSRNMVLDNMLVGSHEEVAKYLINMLEKVPSMSIEEQMDNQVSTTCFLLANILNRMDEKAFASYPTLAFFTEHGVFDKQVDLVDVYKQLCEVFYGINK